MKKLIVLLSLFWYWATLFSQTPQSVPYQAVARDPAGNLMQNQGISLRFTIHDATAGGTVFYQETQAATTNKLGLFNVNVGLGTVVTGTFSNVAWGNGSAKYMQVELDPNGGTNYTNMGTSQMMSVPYALYAANAGAVAGTEPAITAGNTAQYWRGDKTWQTLNTTVVPEGTNLYYTNARGIGSTLTGYASTTGVISSADDIITAIEKLNGNMGTIVSGVSSVNGNTGSVPLTGSSSISISGADVFSINPTYPGQSSITTLGTIGTGTWNATAIGLAYGGTAANLSATGGAGQYLKQSTAGAAITVGTIAVADVPTLNQNTTGNAATATHVAVSGLTAATATNTIDNLNYAQTWNWSTASTQTPLSINANGLSSGTALSLASTSTAGVASSSSTMLNIARSGANANTAHTAYGIYSTVTNTNATSGTNVAGYFSASGATTANYGLLVPNGYVGIGTITPGASLEISRGTDATQLTGTGADLVIQARNAATGDARLAFVSNDNVGNSGAGIIDGWANSYGGSTAKAVEISFPTSQGGSSGQVNGNIAFSVNKGTTSTLTEVMRVASSGYVGIGTNAPFTTLDVLGSIITSNHGNASQHDVSEQGTSYIGHESGTVGLTAFAGMGIKVAPGNNSIANAGIIQFYTWGNSVANSREVARIDERGYLGIGTTSPGYPLQVSGSANSSGSYYYYCGSGCSNGTSSGAYPISIAASNGIQCTQLNIPSDERIKINLGVSDAAKDLETLNRIKITNYKMKDEVVYGDRMSKKVIAQQLKEVYPLAINQSSALQAVPNIYQAATIDNYSSGQLTVSLAKEIANNKYIYTGSTCRILMYSADSSQHEARGRIVSIEGNKLRLDFGEHADFSGYDKKIFIYGTEVNDFLTVDYDAISMLNVSATQELARKVAALEKQNAALINTNQQLDEQNCGLAQKVDALSSVSNEVQLLHQQMDALKTLMEKNGLRTEK